MSKILLLNIVFIWALTSTNCLSQSVNIVPPTPNAMKMTEYYSQRPNVYTGTANVSIPLYTIDFDGWELPLSISYNATGIRTNEEASEVGLGWALNATGVISRTIQDGDDLMSTGRKGYVNNSEPVTFVMGYNWKTGQPPSSSSYYYKLAIQGPDTQPDIFNYNFFGFSGSFILSQKAADPMNPIKVIKITQDASSIAYHESGQSFTVITPDGYKGEFTVKEKSTTFSSSIVALDRMMCCSQANIDIDYYKNTSGRFRTTTSWYLSKITSPHGQVITFNYDLNPDGSSSYLSNSIAFGELPGVTSLNVCLQTVQEHVYLKSILSEEIDVEFSMEMREDIRTNTLFTSVASGSHFKSSLPPKRYNGINITGVDPNSTLDKTIIFRQSYFNQQFQDQVSGNQSATEILWMRSRLDRLVIDDQEYRFYYEKGLNGLPNKLTTGIDHFGFYNGQDQVSTLLPPDPVAGAFLGTGVTLQDTATVEYYKQKWERRVGFSYGKAGLLAKVKYPTRGYTTFEYESHVYLPEVTGYFREENSQSQVGNLAGGARIKWMKEFDYNDTLLLAKSYQYVQKPNVVPASTPTGKLMTPLYHRYAHIWYNQNPPYNALGFNFLHKSNSSIPGNNSAEGKIVGYSKVHEIVSGRGESYVNTYYFENRPNKVLAWNSIAVGYPNLNGQAVEIRNYNSQGKIIQVTQNQDYYHPIDSVKAIAYEQQNHGGQSPYLNYYVFYTIKRTFNTPYSVITTELDQQGSSSEDANGNITYNGMTRQTRTKLYYNKNWLLRYKGQVTARGDSIITKYRRPADYTAPSATIQHMIRDTVNIVDPVIEEITYKNGTVISANAKRFTYDVTNDKVNLSASFSYNPDKGTFTPSSDAYVFSSAYEIKTSFTSYDPATGKLLEYNSPDGLSHSFVWGYNKKLPIVHGIGIGYNQLLQAHNTASSNMATYETTLRNHSNLSGKQVSTYAHNPHVGISKVTDPSGVQGTFEYDHYGRLQLTRDNSGKILKQNKYHLKTLPTTKVMALSSTSLNFGTFYDCVPHPEAQTLTISNNGEGDLIVSSIALPSGFSSSWHGGTIYAGTDLDMEISFIGSPGNYTPQAITIYSDNDAGTLTAPVSANYIASGSNRTIELTPNPSIFPTAHSTQYVEVRNIGNDCLTITGTSLVANDPDWSASLTLLTLAPQQSTTMSVFLKNSDPLTKTFSINSDKNGGNELLGVDIKRIILTPSSTNITFPTFTTQTTSQTFTITNTGNTLLDIISISSNNSKFSFSPSTLQLEKGQQQTITVNYTATDFSLQHLDLTFTSNKTAGANAVTLHAERSQNYQLAWDPKIQLLIKPSDQTDETHLMNTGNVPATISSVPPTSPSGFTVSYLIYSGGVWIPVNPNTSPVTLQPGQGLQLSVTSDSFASANGSVTIYDILGNAYILQLVKSPTI